MGFGENKAANNGSQRLMRRIIHVLAKDALDILATNLDDTIVSIDCGF